MFIWWWRQSYHNMSEPHLMTICPIAVEIFQSGRLTLTSTEPTLDRFLITTVNNLCIYLSKFKEELKIHVMSCIWTFEAKNCGNQQRNLQGWWRGAILFYSILIYYTWDECPNFPVDPDDPSGELCMQPVTCCLSVTKPVKGELIIPAGWFPEASMAPGPRTAAWLFDGHLNYSGSWLIMGQPVATLPRPASCFLLAYSDSRVTELTNKKLEGMRGMRGSHRGRLNSVCYWSCFKDTARCKHLNI